MNLHQRFTALQDEIQELQDAVFRAIRISPRAFAICFYDRDVRSMRASVIHSRTAHELKLLSELDGTELKAYGSFVESISAWCESDNPAEFPIPINEADMASYRTLVDAMTTQD